MAKRRKHSRLVFTLAALAVLAGATVYAFWPRPLAVDTAGVTRGLMRVTVDEEARTRVRDPYVVSTPVAGQLQRVEVRPGDEVIHGKTIVARMSPTNPAVLDVRTAEQARAAVSAAEAALRVARADLNKALADRDLAQSDLDRTRTLADGGIVSKAALERAERTARAAEATVDTTRAAISMRIADLDNAEARLIGINDEAVSSNVTTRTDSVPLLAPADGVILRVIQQSETTLPAGAPIMEIGNISEGLEVEAELLSTDAVNVQVGDPVLIENWGGIGTLMGTVSRIDPFGVTKYSALGVEEQRVTTVIQFQGEPEEHEGLGHGYRVDIRVIVWEDPQALIVPSSALFRDNGGWAAFTVENGVARLAPVRIGQNNGLQAEVLDGVSEGATVVIYPSPELTDGQKVVSRQLPEG